ncbi:MAG: lipid-binding SYLF domain-containing protein, partial [Gluconacetobacter diazotrophicus]|nr:lipid-binding SYLF domain-containing protein [Gluconacetobacter diazotrophicus]
MRADRLPRPFPVRSRRAGAGLLAAAAAAALAGCVSDGPVTPERQQQQQALVDRATLTVADVLDPQRDNGMGRRLLAKAKGVMVCPSIFKMGFLLGGSGGACVLLARDAAGSWSAPAFYSMGSGSVGLQAGVQDAELMLFIMTRKGMTATLDSQFRLGGDASITLATLGAGLEGATTAALRADIVAVEKSKGLFAGLSVQGSQVTSDSTGDRAYYGQPVGPVDILVAMRANNPGADPLRAALMRYAAAGTTTVVPAAGEPAGGGFVQPSEANGPMPLAPQGGVQ